MNCIYLAESKSGGTRCRAAAELSGVAVDLCVIEPATCQQCGRSPESQMVRRLAAMFSIQHGDGGFARMAQEERQREAAKQEARETEQALKEQERAKSTDLSCPHRGAEIRTQLCKPCLGRKLIPVYQCNHPQVAAGECTLSNHLIRHPKTNEKLPVCASCEYLPERANPAREMLKADGNPVQALSKSKLVSETGRFEVVIKSKPVKELPDITGFNRGKQVGGFLVNSIGVNADCLEGQAHGASAFLACGGPSLNDIREELSLLYQRGVSIAAVNQCGATHVRPHYWFAVDEPMKFHPVIWQDPAIMKFVMRRRSRDQPRWKTGRTEQNGRPIFESTGIRARDYPNVWFFEHQMGLDPDKFLHMNPPCWGGDWEHQGRSRQTKSVMLVALRMLYWLGFRRVYLIGCDFKMTPERTYAFGEPKDTRACGYNNNSYEILNHWLTQMRPAFERASFEVLNATPDSGLTAFDRIELRDAIARESFDAASDVQWYYITGSAGG